MLSREHGAAWDQLVRMDQNQLMQTIDRGGFHVEIVDIPPANPSRRLSTDSVVCRAFPCHIDELLMAVCDSGFEIPRHILDAYRYIRGHRMPAQMERVFQGVREPDPRTGERVIGRPYMHLGFDASRFSAEPAAERRRVQKVREEQEARAAAEAKALELVKRVVTPAEFAEYQEKKSIELTGRFWIYKIKKAGQTEIRALGCRHYKGSACVQLTVQAPAEDLLVTNYLTIKNDEKRWLETANITWADPEEKGRKGYDAIMDMMYEAMRERMLSVLAQPMFVDSTRP